MAVLAAFQQLADRLADRRRDHCSRCSRDTAVPAPAGAPLRRKPEPYRTHRVARDPDAGAEPHHAAVPALSSRCSSGCKRSQLGEKLEPVLHSIITIALFWQTGVWAAAAVRAWVQRRRAHTPRRSRRAAGQLGIISFIASVLIWSLVLLATLDNLGVNITALVAGLGIGGVAVALAVQNVLGDLFASLSIVLDQPFVVGDFLVVDNYWARSRTSALRPRGCAASTASRSSSRTATCCEPRAQLRAHARAARGFATNVAYETPVELIERIPILYGNASSRRHALRSLAFPETWRGVTRFRDRRTT